MRGTMHGERNPSTPAPNATMKLTFTAGDPPLLHFLYSRHWLLCSSSDVPSSPGTRTRKTDDRPPAGLAMLLGERLDPDRSSHGRREVFGGTPLPHCHLEQPIASRDDDDATWCGIPICAFESRRTSFAPPHHVHRAAVCCQRGRRNRGDEVPKPTHIDPVPDHRRTVLA